MSWSFYVQCIEVRGDCLFCWYWWNCWQSMFKFYFHKCTNSALPLPYFLQTLGDYIRNGDLRVSIHFDVFYFHCLRDVGLYTGISCTWWCSCLFLKRCVVIPGIESSDWPSNIKYCIIFNTPRQKFRPLEALSPNVNFQCSRGHKVKWHFCKSEM